MNILELILFVIISYFAGYGFAAWQEDRDKERAIRSKERREIMKGLREPMWQGPYWRKDKK